MNGLKSSSKSIKVLLVVALSLLAVTAARAETQGPERYVWGITTQEIPRLQQEEDLNSERAGRLGSGVATLESIDVVQSDLAQAEAELEASGGDQLQSISIKERRSQAPAAPTMTLPQILEQALANNPEVGMALAREEQAQWFHRESKAYKYPSVDVINEFGPEYNRPATNASGNEDVTPGRSLTFRISHLLYDGGVSESEEARRFEVRKSTELETRLIIEDLVLETTRTYLRVLQQQQVAQAAEEFVSEMTEIVDKIEVMYENGAASKLELDFAKARLASATAETGNTAAQLNDAVSGLEFFTGALPPFTAVPPQAMEHLHVGSLEYYQSVAQRKNANILLSQTNKAAERLKIRGQRGQFHPILSINFGSRTLADEGGNQSLRNTSEVKLRAEYFLFDGGARRSRLNRAKARLKELEWEDQLLLNELERNVKQAYNQITTNRLTLNATRDEINYNRELRRLNRQNLEIGDISIIELIEVEERLFNSQASWFQVSAEVLQSYYDLLIEVGEFNQVVQTQLSYSRLEEP
ncbi:MAG: TolC family protein [Pseudomonadota bacterium]